MSENQDREFVSSYRKPDILEATRGAAGRLLKEIRPAIPQKTTLHAPTMANHAYDAIEDALVSTGSAIASARGASSAITLNTDWAPDGKRERLQALSDKTDAKVDSGVTVLRNATEALVSELEAAALPTAPEKADQLALARDNTLALIDRAKGDAKREVFLRLATRNDEMAALLLSGYGKDLASILFGDSLGEALWNQARATHLAEAAERGEPSAMALRAAKKMAGITHGFLAAWSNDKETFRKSVRG